MISFMVPDFFMLGKQNGFKVAFEITYTLVVLISNTATSQQSEHSSLGGFGLEVAVPEQRLVARAPAVCVVDAPSGDGHALRGVQACLDDVGVVGRRSPCNIELSDGNINTRAR